MRVDEAIAAVKRNSSHAGELIDDNYIATEVASVLVDEVEELEAALADMTEARDALAVQFEFAKAELWCFDDRIMYASVMDSYERLGAKVKELKAAIAEREAQAADQSRRIEKLADLCEAWMRLVNNAERAIGMDSVAVDPSARSLVEWCDTAKREHEAWELLATLDHFGLGKRTQEGPVLYIWEGNFTGVTPLAAVLLAKAALAAE